MMYLLPERLHSQVPILLAFFTSMVGMPLTCKETNFPDQDPWVYKATIPKVLPR